MVTADGRAFRSALAATLRAEFAAAQMIPAHEASKIGINYATLRRSLAGERDMTVYEFTRIAEHFGIPYTELIARTHERLARQARAEETIRKRTTDEFG